MSEGVPVSATDNYTPTRAERIELEKALLAALKQCGISVRWALAGPSELFDVADVLLQSEWLAAERAKAWDEGYEAAARFHESPKGHWQNNHPRAGIRTWIADPAPKNPYREVQ